MGPNGAVDMDGRTKHGLKKHISGQILWCFSSESCICDLEVLFCEWFGLGAAQTFWTTHGMMPLVLNTDRLLTAPSFWSENLSSLKNFKMRHHLPSNAPVSLVAWDNVFALCPSSTGRCPRPIKKDAQHIAWELIRFSLPKSGSSAEHWPAPFPRCSS